MSVATELTAQHAAAILDAGSDDDDDLPDISMTVTAAAAAATASAATSSDAKGAARASFQSPRPADRRTASPNASDARPKKGRALRTETARVADKKQQQARVTKPQHDRARARRHRVASTSDKPLQQMILTHGLNALLHRSGTVRRQRDVPVTLRCIALAVCGEIMQAAYVLTRFTDRKQVRNKDIAAAGRYKLVDHVIVEK